MHKEEKSSQFRIRLTSFDHQTLTFHKNLLLMRHMLNTDLLHNIKPNIKTHAVTYIIYNIRLSLPVEIIQLLLQSFQTVT